MFFSEMSKKGPKRHANGCVQDTSMDMSIEDKLFALLQKGKGHGTWTYWGHLEYMLEMEVCGVIWYDKWNGILRRWQGGKEIIEAAYSRSPFVVSNHYHIPRSPGTAPAPPINYNDSNNDAI